MKYKLKKDLPFAKAGTEARYFYGVSQNHVDYNEVTQTVDIYQKNEGDLILWKDWIEEVKPREWILEITKDSHYIRPPDATGKLYDSNSEVIKVREVIE